MTSDHADEPDSRITRWLRALGPSAVLIAFALVQRPGRIAGDTKLDLAVDPAGYLGRALQLWDSTGAAGQLQNQAYGYLWPMGPFFALTDLMSIPPWFAQRMWWALLLLVGFHGMHTLLVRMGVGTRSSRLIAAFGYALAPRMLLGLGAVSAEIWPMAMAPWVLVPLVVVGRDRDLWPAALRSAVAVLMTGAVNAVATGAVLVLPVLWILTRAELRWRLLWRWAVAVLLVSVWWIGPLLMLGRYSPPFLSWIESAQVSTALASATEALRGTTQWLAVIGGPSGSLWPAGPAVVTSTPAVSMGLALALLGLVGVYAAPARWAWFTRLGLLAGLVLVTLGSTTGGLPLNPTGALQPLLDGVLAPLRNTHKFEPVIRIPLTIGIAHAIPLLASWGVRKSWWNERLVPIGAAAAVLAVAASPAFVGVVQRGDFEDVPGYWHEAADYLAQTDDGGRTLVVPGNPSPESYWGNPRDEPLQPLAHGPWAVRNGVPLGSAGATRLLNDVEARLASGYGGQELQRVLRSLGVTRVVLRADLDYASTGAPEPLVTDAALRSAGLERVHQLGPDVGLSVAPTLRPFAGESAALPAIGVYELATKTKIAEEHAVGDPVIAAGGPESVAMLEERRPVILASDAQSRSVLGQRRAPVVLTDTLQRREANFAAVRSMYGELLGADEPYRAKRSTHDWLMPWLPDDAGSAQTTAVLDGATSVEASSSLVVPELGQARDLSAVPTSALDSSGDTAWRSSGSEAVGQWVEVRWDAPRELPSTVRVTFDMEDGARIAAVTASTEGGEARTPITDPQLTEESSDRYAVDVSIPPGRTDRLRLQVSETYGAGGTVMIRDIGAGVIPRVEVWGRMPTAGGQQVDSVLMQTSTDRAYGCVPDREGVVRCRAEEDRAGEDETDLRREFDLPARQEFTITGTVIARPGSSSLLQRIDGVAVETSSEFHSPQTSAPLAVDGDAATYWAAQPGDEQPWIELSWDERRATDRVVLRTDESVGGLVPTRVEVRSDDTAYERAVGDDGQVTFPALDGRTLRITVLETEPSRAGALLPVDEPSVVIGEVQLGDATWDRAAGDQKVGLGCGFGPTLQIDGEDIRTKVTGTRDQLTEGRPLSLQACDEVQLGSGTHRVRVLASPDFSPRTLSLSGGEWAAPERAVVTKGAWGSTERVLQVGSRNQAVVLQVRENRNAGWVATSEGEELPAVTVDGWAQGWVLPAGGEGQVDLTFEPQRTYALLLVGGLVLAAFVTLAALLTRRDRPSRLVPLRGDPPRAWVRWGVGAVTIAFLGGPLALVGLLVTRVPDRFRLPALMVLGVAWVAFSAAAPWPSELATNRSAVSQLLALVLVGAVVVAPDRGRG